jgi:aspartate/methionine/tyrosine aminotransferase
VPGYKAMVVIPVMIDPFLLERFFAKNEFDVRYTLTSSDCEPLTLEKLLELADEETRETWDNLELGYTEYRGAPELREEISSLYDAASPDDVLVAAPEEGIFIAMNSLLEKGDHVICTFPGYQSLFQLAESIGCEVDLWEPEEGAGWSFDPEFVAARLRPGTRLIVMNFPHNPTGAVLPKDSYDRVIELARARGIAVFSDEMYRFLEHDPAGRLAAACDVYEKAVSLFGMSKSFGLAGLRLGWLVTRDRALYDRMAGFKDYTTICPPAPSEVLSLIALRAREVILGGNLALIGRNLSKLDRFFERRAEMFSWNPPAGGSVALPRLLLDLSSPEFCSRVQERTGVLLMPSSVFGYGSRHFRLGFGREDMPEALGRFDEYLDALK